MREAMRIAGYDELRREQAEKRERGELMGIGVAFFTEAVGAGPRKDMDILGLGMADGCELRVHPTGKAVVRVSCMSQGQGHETTFAQIVAEEIGIPPADIQVVNGDTDQTPFGLGTYGSRSTPVSGAAAALVARKVRDKARIIASGMLEVSVADLEWEKGSFHVKGDPTKSVTIQDIAMRAHGAGDLPEGHRGRAGGADLLQPVEPHLPARRLHLRRRHRPGHRRGQGAPVHRGRRLRHPDQPDDHRGPGPRRPHRRRRHGADGDDRLRRGRQLPRRLADGLPDPDRARGARLGDRVHRHAVAAPPDRRQGRRRVGDRRFAARDRQRGRRRAQAVRDPARRHAADAVAGVGRHAGPPARRRSERHRYDEGRRRERPDRRTGSRTRGRRVPFVHATVVRAQVPDVRARRATHAIVLADGSIEGFVGGQCAESSVRDAALDALANGETVLLRVLPEDGGEVPGVAGRAGGRQPVPVRGRPGDLPRADAAAAAARRSSGRRRSPTRWSRSADVARLRRSAAWRPGDADRDGATAVVVASHGRDEVAPIRAALDAGVGFVGLVAAARAAEVLSSTSSASTSGARPGQHARRPGHRCAHGAGDRAVDPRRGRPRDAPERAAAGRRRARRVRHRSSIRSAA